MQLHRPIAAEFLGEPSMPIWEEDRRAEPEMPRSLLVRGPSTTPSSASSGAGHRQYRQMLAALAILTVALVLVVVNNWSFWFPSTTTTAVTADNSGNDAEESEVEIGAPGAGGPTHKARSKANTAPPVASAESSEAAPGASITATQRTELPPLEVEVVAGGQHRTVQPQNNSVKVDMQSESMPPTREATPTAQVEQPVTDASATVRLSPQTAEVLSRPVEPSYPLLAKQMKVQGAVVLEALIGKEGSIENLRVLSGPAILSSAAMEAVKQWRFKPYFQNGRPVETQARITVNFTISTS